MKEVINKQRWPIQIILRSRSKRNPTTNNIAIKNIPGVGSGNNKAYIEDEMMTEYVYRLEREKLIKINNI